jgi:integrase
MDDFTNRHINDFVIARSREVGRSAVYNELRTLKTFFNLCERLYNIPAPTKNISVQRPDRKEPRVYSQEDIRKMLVVTSGFERAALLLDLQAGLRKSEMATRK